MNASSDRPALRINSVPGLLAAIPHLLGFTPTVSLVVVGATAAGGVQLAFRYDLPDPPDSTVAGDIAAHAMSVLARKQLTIAIAVGYGPGRLVTPLADALRVSRAPHQDQAARHAARRGRPVLVVPVHQPGVLPG